MSAILEARGLCKRFDAVTPADDISVVIEADSVVGLIGGNGAGKTTFVNMVTGYVKPDSGTIRYAGRDITALSPRRITHLGICRSFQIPQLFDTLSVRDNMLAAVAIAAGAVGRAERAAATRQVAETVEWQLERLGLAAYAERRAGALPEGLRKLLDVAMAMAARPRILLLDEPTSGVSSDEKFAIMDMVMGAAEAASITTLFVEHDMDIVGRYAQRILAFYDGRIIADGSPQAVLADADVQRYVIGEEHAHAAD